jgi:hypothetical protein
MLHLFGKGFRSKVCGCSFMAKMKATIGSKVTRAKFGIEKYFRKMLHLFGKCFFVPYILQLLADLPK